MDGETKSAVDTISDVFEELVSLQRGNLETSQTIVRMLLGNNKHARLLAAFEELRKSHAIMTQKLDEILHLVQENGG